MPIEGRLTTRSSRSRCGRTDILGSTGACGSIRSVQGHGFSIARYGAERTDSVTIIRALPPESPLAPGINGTASRVIFGVARLGFRSKEAAFGRVGGEDGDRNQRIRSRPQALFTALCGSSRKPCGRRVDRGGGALRPAASFT
jgi:hypothetical protein